MIPQSFQRSPSTNFSGQDARLLQYQDVLSKIATDQSPNALEPVTNVHHFADWSSDDEDGGETKFRVVESREIGPLLGGFADVENSIK